MENKLKQMVANNPLRMDYFRKYQEIIADYNRDKDRVTIEETFAKLVDLVSGLDVEGRRDRIGTEHRELVRRLDKAVASGALHRNAAARKKAQAAKLVSGSS